MEYRTNGQDLHVFKRESYFTPLRLDMQCCDMKTKLVLPPEIGRGASLHGMVIFSSMEHFSDFIHRLMCSICRNCIVLLLVC